MANELDDAFNWLIVILGIIAGALTQFPQLGVYMYYGFYIFPEQTSQIVPLNIDYLLLRSLIFPIVFLVFFRLFGLLIRRSELQAMLKFLSWVLASIVLVVDLVILGPFTIIRAYFPPTFWSTWKPELGPPVFIIVTALLSYSFMIIFPLSFSFLIVRPRMREIYKDSRFLYSLRKQIFLFIAAVLLYLLAIGGLETIILQESSPTLPKW
jgi:hypothetical protein